jgi:hypothetical protein
MLCSEITDATPAAMIILILFATPARTEYFKCDNPKG